MSPLDHKPPPLLLRPGIKKAVPHSDNYSLTEKNLLHFHTGENFPALIPPAGMMNAAVTSFSSQPVL